MRYNERELRSWLRNLRLPIVGGFLLLNSSCAHVKLPVTVAEAEWCAPINGEAACDKFLVSDPQWLDAQGWATKQAAWLADGGVVECTSSKTMIDTKVFIDDVCSEITCNQAQKAKIVAALQKLARLGIRP